MERRKFLGWVGLGMLATNLPIVLAACSSGSSSSTTPTKPVSTTTPKVSMSPDAEGFVTIGTATELKETGSIVNKTLGAIVVSKGDGTLSALNPRCPHQGCTVAIEKGSSELICPCHGSKFSTDGKVVKGPATEDLPSYPVKQTGDSILVKVS